MDPETRACLGEVDIQWHAPPPGWSRGANAAFALAAGLLCTFVVLRILSAICRSVTRRKYGVAANAVVVGFFHPYCDAGGGGERVLWKAMQALDAHYSGKNRPLHVLVYTGDRGVTPDAILRRVEERFGITLASTLPLDFVYLRSRPLLSASLYPVFTVLGQSLGSMALALEALWRAMPDVFFDSTGLAFSFPIARLAGCRVGAYVHYPTVSADMFRRVRDGRVTYNHRGRLARSYVLTLAKLVYYSVLALLYGLCGSLATVVMVNSSWTRKHIAALWGGAQPTVVYPPCDAAGLCTLPLARKGAAARTVISVGQFRPEKDHCLQIDVIEAVRRLAPELEGQRLVIVGGSRGKEDEALVERLKRHARDKGVADNVEFVVNCGYEELRRRLGSASVGIHTMQDEHFGIGVVEMMAAGLVVVAHNSGGPKSDIIMPYRGVVTGLLAETAEEYAERVDAVLRPEPGEDWAKVRAMARESTSRFSDSEFCKRFAVAFDPLCQRAG